MKHLKNLLLTGVLVAVGYGVSGADPAVLYAVGIRDGAQTAPTTPDDWWPELQVQVPGYPLPTNTDNLILNVVGTQIDARMNHGGGPIDIAAFSDGVGSVAYPGQLPDDYPGVNVPAVSVFWTLAAPTDVVAVAAYCFNFNNPTEGDARAIPIVDIYTTTDATPSAGGNWDLYIEKAHTNVAPLDLTYLDETTYRGASIIVGDSAGDPIGTGLTGVRVDFYASGFGQQIRDPEFDGGGNDEAVASPFIAEVVVLDEFPDGFELPDPETSVGNWHLY